MKSVRILMVMGLFLGMSAPAIAQVTGEQGSVEACELIAKDEAKPQGEVHVQSPATSTSTSEAATVPAAPKKR